MWMLDTNIWIALLNGTYPALAETYRSHRPSEIIYPSIVRAELLYGAEKSKSKQRSQRAVDTILLPHREIPFGPDNCAPYATIRASLEGKGTPIGSEDYIIAACALAEGATLVTRNTKEFQRVPGLKLDRW